MSEAAGAGAGIRSKTGGASGLAEIDEYRPARRVCAPGARNRAPGHGLDTDGIRAILTSSKQRVSTVIAPMEKRGWGDEGLGGGAIGPLYQTVGIGTSAESTLAGSASTAALGQGSTALGQRSAALGQNTATLSQSSAALGQRSTALGQSTAALGQRSTALSQRSAGETPAVPGGRCSALVAQRGTIIPLSFSEGEGRGGASSVKLRPAMAHDLVLFNTLGRSLEPFQPLVPEEARIYICGPTVYNDPTSATSVPSFSGICCGGACAISGTASSR